MLNAILNLYVAGELAAEEDEYFWADPERNGQAHRNVNVYPELLASVLAAYRRRHNTPFGSHAGIVRFVLRLYLARLAEGKGD